MQGFITNYNFNEHKHRFAQWTAARAVARSFTTTEIISTAIDSTTLREFSEDNSAVSQDEFDRLHNQWCEQIVASLQNLSPAISEKCTYGRAAKVVAIYLKTSVILPSHGSSEKSKVIHPPIDRILLQNLHRDKKIDALSNWTRLDKGGYIKLVKTLRQLTEPFNWQLEAYWTLQSSAN